MNIQLKYNNQEAKDLYNGKFAPSTEYSAGVDLRIMEDLVLGAGEVKMVTSGVSVFIGNPDYCAKIFPRSGMGHKMGIVLGNLTGIIDSDYQGEIKLSLWNRSTIPQELKKGERVCQLIFERVYHPKINEVLEFSDTTSRAKGGFGSSGKL